MSRRANVHRNSSGERWARAGDEAIAALAARQYGVASRAQLRALGESDDEIDYRLATKRLHPLWRSVYAIGHARVSPEGRWLGAVLASGAEAVLSHRSAARLWGLLPWNGRIEVTVPSWRRPQTGIVARESMAAAGQRTTYRGIPVTTVARTLLDLGAVDPMRVSKALEQSETLGLFNLTEVESILAANERRPGSALLRREIDDRREWATVTRSDMEDLFRQLIASSSLPRPAMNQVLDVAGWMIEPDALWRPERLIVELDSRAFHDTPSAFERDRRRDRALVAAGWRVIRITWRQLTREWNGVLRDLDRALSAPLAQRSPQ